MENQHRHIKGYRDLPTQQGTMFRDYLDYDAPSRSLNLRMPLYNAEALRRWLAKR